MSKTYKTKSIDEALKLAKKFQKSGKYNLFRGQAQNWEVKPTAGRLSNKQFEKSKEQIERLFIFFNTDISLKKHCKEVDSFFAIAQHYGIPTNYIDFTESVEVAFYFATNSKSNKIQDECSIICLNEKDFKEFIQFIKVQYEKRMVIPPYISRIEVENLWRLQAQKGCFLFTPYDRIEQYYHFDRIIFPYTTPFSEIDGKDIYPERKSELEIILDHYFDTEKRIKGYNRLLKFSKELNIPITTISKHNQFEIIEKKEVHKSWYSYTYRKWKYSFNERWKSSKNEKSINLCVPLKINQDEFIKNVKTIIYGEFVNKKIDRETPLNFELSVKPKLSEKNSMIISKNCKNIWDGTRNLPYEDKDIFTILATYLFLEFKDQLLQNHEEQITLEMTNKYGSRTRFKANKNKIVSFFRNDIDDVVLSNLPRPIPSELLLHINKPRYIFDFVKLIEFFKIEAVANQVFYNREDEYPVIFYTPVQIDVLGYA
ncbi:MAG: hypothetical protein RLZZ540_984 [Bacteroidota bacterium]|jgi:hypothetical protein